MFKKIFGFGNDKVSSLVRSGLIGIGSVLTTLGLVGGEEWAVFSSNIDVILGGVFAVWAAVQGWLSKDRAPAPVVTPKAA